MPKHPPVIEALSLGQGEGKAPEKDSPHPVYFPIEREIGILLL